MKASGLENKIITGPASTAPCVARRWPRERRTASRWAAWVKSLYVSYLYTQGMPACGECYDNQFKEKCVVCHQVVTGG